MAKRVSATVAKNQLGRIMRLAEQEPVYIVKHGKPQTVVIGAAAYENLVSRARDRDDLELANLRAEFEAMYASMQTERSQKKVDALLNASADQLNKAAARRIRKSRG
ncbi:MAG TPA: type II toxin-antitoxin system prevent-host-death family antitoxin [Polyangia bacterium]